jgi:hypothetical protein
MTGRQFRVAKGAENEPAQGMARSDQVSEQLQTTGVGPLEIVEYQDQGLTVTDVGQQTYHCPE